MKKLILILALVAITAVSFGQAVKKDTAKPKPVYEKFVKLSERDFSQLMGYAHQYRDGLIYIPQLQPLEKLQGQAFLDDALSAIYKEKRLDSTLVAPKPVKKDTLKK